MPSRLRSRTPSLAAALAAIPLLLLLPSRATAAGTFVEKSVDVPRATKVPVDVTYEKAVIQWVESQNDPKGKDVDDASRNDPGDRTWILLRFTYANEGYVSHEVNLRAILLDEAGGVLAEGGRKSSLDRQKKQDTISFPIHVRTLDWPRGAKLKVMATFYE